MQNLIRHLAWDRLHFHISRFTTTSGVAPDHEQSMNLKYVWRLDYATLFQPFQPTWVCCIPWQRTGVLIDQLWVSSFAYIGIGFFDLQLLQANAFRSSKSQGLHVMYNKAYQRLGAACHGTSLAQIHVQMQRTLMQVIGNGDGRLSLHKRKQWCDMNSIHLKEHVDTMSCPQHPPRISCHDWAELVFRSNAGLNR